ncbi:acyl-CoA dehydrogenase family protein [Streptomyces griseoruber]|uniref:Acyl-CoA dehydrogenase n=1 Tax=Streptomyces griseoruber TaxID=1943 RepID=A0A101SVB5_9ACTN|nr:acyl-CoA dehydrogenase family protein [Streptomyces griseoruber]KUN80748.1 acyl-CoA dehydrogenase [Streptomyces griseoruber]
MDPAERTLLADALRKTLVSGAGLADLGWPDMLAEEPETVVPLLFRLLGETGRHTPALNDVLLHAAGLPLTGTPALPFGGARLVWLRDGSSYDSPLDPELPLRHARGDEPSVPLAAGRRALGWWLLGTGHAMLALARRHVLDREQFGRPLASFQALRHRLAETYVALEGAEAALTAATDDTGSLLAKAAAGRAALTAARHCQQALGGIGFTAEHELHRHVRRALVLDALLGSARELTREAGVLLVREGRTPRLVDL